jgi:trigger factor
VDVNITTLTEVSREVEIQATPGDLQPHFEKAYKQYRPKAEIKGFRKGHAPLELIKKLYGEAIEYESLETIAAELYRQIVKEKELKPIGDPTLVDLDYKRGEHLRCKIQYDVRPAIQLKKYKGLSVDTVVHNVTDEELEAELLRLRKINSTTEEAGQVTNEEHIVSTEIQELDDAGLAIIGKKSDNVRFYLADPQLEQPFKDALKATAKGNEHYIKFEHQHDEHTHQVNLKVKVTKVERVIVPDLNDEFVKKVTKDKITSVEAFRKSVREDLESYWKEKNRRNLVNAMVSEIIRLHEFQVPESLIKSVLDGLLEEIKNQYPKKQLPDDFDSKKFSEENRAYAIFQAKWALLREEIIKAENLTVDDQALKGLAEREAPKIGIDKERLIAYYKSSEQVKDRLLSDKLMDLLIGSTKVKEIQDTTLSNKLVKG